MENKKRNAALSIAFLTVLGMGWVAGVLGYRTFDIAIVRSILFIFAFLLVSWGPSFPIERLERKLVKENAEDSTKGGVYIGLAERSLIFCAVWIINVVEGVSIGEVFSFLSIIIAGKSIYRFPSQNANGTSKTTRQWYISGTFISMTVGIFLSCLLIPDAPLFQHAFQ